MREMTEYEAWKVRAMTRTFHAVTKAIVIATIIVVAGWAALWAAVLMKDAMQKPRETSSIVYMERGETVADFMERVQ